MEAEMRRLLCGRKWRRGDEKMAARRLVGFVLEG
jgi:hypothetical protein